MKLVFEYRPEPKYDIPKLVMLSSEHRAALDRLKSKHRLSHSEVLRRGVELMAERFASGENSGAVGNR